MSEAKTDSDSKVTCKYCQSQNTRKFGTYKGVQRYFCNSCNRKFIANDNLFQMKTPAKQVSAAINMYYNGSSIKDISNQLQQDYGNHPSKKTVFEWIDKYTSTLLEVTKDLKPIKTGSRWIADETVLDVAGQKLWLYDIIDDDTRFVLATRLTTTYGRTTNDARRLMEMAAKRAGKTPKEVVTDRNNSYLDGIELAYGADSEHLLGTPFAKADSGESTSKIERWHETLKERYKVMRGLKNYESAKQFIDGFVAHYNFIRTNEALNNRTPADVAGVGYNFKNWYDIILMAKPQVKVLTTPQAVSIVPTVKPKISKTRTPLINRNVFPLKRY